MLFSALLCLWPNGAALAAEPECAALTPEDSGLGYQRHDDRCEGFYLPQLRAELRVVSFIVGAGLSFSWGADSKLEISRSDSFESPMNVRAVSLQRNVFYRMDAVIDTNESLNLAIGPYLYPRNVEPDQLGIYGWTGTEHEKVFSPVAVRQGNQGTASGAIAILRFTTVADLTHFRWSLFPPEGKICHLQPDLQEFRFYDDDMSAGSVIDVEMNVGGGLDGPRCLELQYRPDNGRWKSEMLRLGF